MHKQKVLYILPLLKKIMQKLIELMFSYFQQGEGSFMDLLTGPMGTEVIKY
jgi:hypothetical protein